MISYEHEKNARNSKVAKEDPNKTYCFHQCCCTRKEKEFVFNRSRSGKDEMRRNNLTNL